MPAAPIPPPPNPLPQGEGECIAVNEFNLAPPEPASAVVAEARAVRDAMLSGRFVGSRDTEPLDNPLSERRLPRPQIADQQNNTTLGQMWGERPAKLFSFFRAATYDPRHGIPPWPQEDSEAGRWR